MGLYLSKKKIENKIQELNAHEVYIIENEENLKIKEIEFEEKIKLLNVLEAKNVASIKQLILLYNELSSSNDKFKKKKEILFNKLTEYEKLKKLLEQQKKLLPVLLEKLEAIN